MPLTSSRIFAQHISVHQIFPVHLRLPLQRVGTIVALGGDRNCFRGRIVFWCLPLRRAHACRIDRGCPQPSLVHHDWIGINERSRVFHMNVLRLNAVSSDASSSNHSPPLRLEAHLEVPLPPSTLWASGRPTGSWELGQGMLLTIQQTAHLPAPLLVRVLVDFDFVTSLTLHL